MARTIEEYRDLNKQLECSIRAVKILAGIAIPERVTNGTITETQVISMGTVIREWNELDEYSKNVVVRYNSEVYRFIADTPYKRSIHPEWTPEGYVNGWKMYRSKDPKFALPYKYRNSVDVYMTGEYMIWTDNNVYMSNADNNSHTPESNIELWELIGSADELVIV